MVMWLKIKPKSKALKAQLRKHNIQYYGHTNKNGTNF